MGLLTFLALGVQAQPDPVIVRIIQPPRDPTEGLADVLIGSLGLSGAITVLAILCGIVMGGVLFWIRSRSE